MMDVAVAGKCNRCQGTGQMSPDGWGRLMAGPEWLSLIYRAQWDKNLTTNAIHPLATAPRERWLEASPCRALRLMFSRVA
jgi:hypothetical protein